MTFREQRGWLFSDAINAFDDIIYILICGTFQHVLLCSVYAEW